MHDTINTRTAQEEENQLRIRDYLINCIMVDTISRVLSLLVKGCNFKMNKICVFCFKRQQPFTLFTAESLKTCYAILKIRSIYKLTYADINLPCKLGDIECYHTVCYRKFTALSKKYRAELLSLNASSREALQYTTEDEEGLLTLDPRQTLNFNTSNDTSEMAESTWLQVNVPEIKIEADEDVIKEDKICLFCNKTRKIHNGNFQNLHTSEKNSIAATISALACKVDDIDMMEKLQDIIDSNQKINYHISCVNSFKNECNRQAEKEESTISKQRKCYKLAYESVCSFVKHVVIMGKEHCNLSRLRDMFIQQLEEEICKDDLGILSSYIAPWYFKKKLLETFKGQIKVISVGNFKIVIPATGVNIEDFDFEEIQDTDCIESAALILRKTILSAEKEQLLSHLKIENIDGLYQEIPNLLTDFYSLLLSGQRTQCELSADRKRLVQSLSEDLVNAVSNNTEQPNTNFVKKQRLN